jgi:hypothetical protein
MHDRPPTNATPPLCPPLLVTEFEAAKASTWVVSGWGSISNSSDPETGMGGDYAKELQYGITKYVEPSEKQCANLIAGSEETMLWWVAGRRGDGCAGRGRGCGQLGGAGAR